MRRKKILSLALATVMLSLSLFTVTACGKEKESYIIDGSSITVNKACVVRYEAENADIEFYQISSDNDEKIMQGKGASDGKYLAAAIDSEVGVDGASYFTFTLNLAFPAQFTMTAAYSQPEGKKGNDMDMAKSYAYLIDENKSMGLEEGMDTVLYARDDVSIWQEFEYELNTLPAGAHVFRAFVLEKTGNGNPDIDYLEFYFTEVSASAVEGISVSDNDFHTPLQYAYLQDDPRTVTDNYVQGVIENSRPRPITVDFSALSNSSSYVLEYADNASFNNSVKVTDIKSKTYGIYNLELGQQLYWRAATSVSGLAKSKVKGNLTIADQGPRNLYVDGVSNVRDIGGYDSYLVDGGKIRQNLYFRGANLDSITEAGKAEMLRLGIKTEIDLRDADQCEGPYVDGIEYHAVSIPSRTESTRFEKFEKEYKEIFTLIEKADEQPIFLHCTAGADRTGIVSFMLLAVCGASERNIQQDYAFTNFSVQGARYFTSEFDKWWTKLDGFGYETKADNAKAWLISKGLTVEQVEHIREIFVEGYVADYSDFAINNPNA